MVTRCDRKALMKNADVSEEMQQCSVECVTQALEKYNTENDTAAHIKKEFDKKFNPTWHCQVTHQTKHFIYFYLGQVAILLFKSGSKHRLCHTPSDPSKNKDCSLNSKYQRLKSLALLREQLDL